MHLYCIHSNAMISLLIDGTKQVFQKLWGRKGNKIDNFPPHFILLTTSFCFVQGPVQSRFERIQPGTLPPKIIDISSQAAPEDTFVSSIWHLHQLSKKESLISRTGQSFSNQDLSLLILQYDFPLDKILYLITLPDTVTLNSVWSLSWTLFVLFFSPSF